VSSTLFIRVAEDLDQPVEWLLAGAHSSGSRVERCLLADLDTSAGTDTVILAPAACVTLMDTDVPTRNRGQLLKAVPYALEEELAEPVENLHFSVQPRRDGKTLVAVVRMAWMEDLLRRLGQLGISPRAVVPEILCLPWQEAEWTLLLEDTEAVLRTGRQSGFVIDTDNLEAMLRAARQDALDTLPSSLRVIERRRSAGSLDNLLPEGFKVTLDDGPTPPIALLTATYFEQRPLNLLQGDLAAESDWRGIWLKWRLAAALAGGMALVHMTDVVLENRTYEARLEGVRSAMTEVYRETFPDAVRVINPVVQLRNRLKEMKTASGQSGGGSFLGIIAGAGKHVIEDDKVRVKLVRYRNGQVEVDLDADTIEQLEAVQRRLRNAKFSAELKSVNNEGGRFQGRILLNEESS